MPTAQELIQRRSALARGLIADRTANRDLAERGWVRMAQLLHALDDPQLTVPSIHVAGSKGKGTTTYVAAALLTSAGLRVGRYVSPHLLEWNERIAVNDQSISTPDFERLLVRVDQTMASLESGQPERGAFNAFELLTAAAFLYFAESQCDWTVIEVGLGGRFDSTNHLQPATTVITRIEMEHADILGPGLAEIAWNKAGIIRPDVPAVVARQSPEALAMIAAEAEVKGAQVFLEDRDWMTRQDGDRLEISLSGSRSISLPDALPGNHNQSNVGAALTAVHLATESPLDPGGASDALLNLRIPGRFERRVDPRTGHSLILDVAHTPESIEALVSVVIETTGAIQFPFVISLLDDKPAEQILRLVAPFAALIAFPPASNPRAWSPRDLVELAGKLGIDSIASPSIAAALDLVPTAAGPGVITGSFAIVAEALRMMSA